MTARNRPTSEGYLIGAALADAADKGEPAARLKLPELPPRCQSCAFRWASIPNGCPETVIDALHCLGVGNTFFCHQKDRQDLPCSGYLMAREDRKIVALGKAADAIEPGWLDRAGAADGI